MAQQSFAGLAVFIALTFALMALNACASSKHEAAASAERHAFVPEFHGSAIGGDALRSRLDSEN
jgi:hypothetical protein